jgi:DNA-binding HxlR family transcriptional regulator
MRAVYAKAWRESGSLTEPRGSISELDGPEAIWFAAGMSDGGYKQFCPIAKGAEIVATRWTPLILRELMFGERGFNDIHRGVPLMSRALLVDRLRQLEDDGVIAKRARRGGKGYEWRLTQAGEALREVIGTLGRWGLIYGRDRVRTDDHDSTVLMWALRRRVNRKALPDRRIVIRFDLSGVARCKTGLRLHWLVLEPDSIDVCYKDPGYTVDAVVVGEVSALIAVYLGHMTWREATGRALAVRGEREVVRHMASWLQLDKRVGRELPVVPPAARPVRGALKEAR